MKERICSFFVALIEIATCVLCVRIFSLIVTCLLKETSVTIVTLCVLVSMLIVVGIVFFVIDGIKNFINTFKAA